jgi:uncharacterized RDD family membrane protein YckC
MNLKCIARLYGCFFYEVIIQVALWFLITLIILVSLGDSYSINSSLLGFILWLSSGTYFIYSWVNGGQTLAMRAWKLKLLPPKNFKLTFFIYRYILASIGLFIFLSFYLFILFGGKKYIHDMILKSQIICTRTY